MRWVEGKKLRAKDTPDWQYHIFSWISRKMALLRVYLLYYLLERLVLPIQSVNLLFEFELLRLDSILEGTFSNRAIQFIPFNLAWEIQRGLVLYPIGVFALKLSSHHILIHRYQLFSYFLINCAVSLPIFVLAQVANLPIVAQSCVGWIVPRWSCWEIFLLSIEVLLQSTKALMVLDGAI
jgi:hypothetical protein